MQPELPIIEDIQLVPLTTEQISKWAKELTSTLDERPASK